MNDLPFVKMQGAGNDFIMVDNREGVVSDEAKVNLVKTICPRATAVGSDGVVFIENDPEYDFRWDFYNADGSSAEMCGNGARCAAVFAERIGAAHGEMTFRTIAGPIQAATSSLGARVRLTDSDAPVALPPLQIGRSTIEGWFMNTGVPHVILPSENLDEVDIIGLGAAVRFHEHFAPSGTNVNVLRRNKDGIAIRTYERGVEGETLACGTGAAACAVTSVEAYGLASPVTVRTASGDLLRISFCVDSQRVTDLWLEGPANVIYAGVLFPGQ